MKGFAFKTSLLGLSLLSCVGEGQLYASTRGESKWIGLMQQQEVGGVVRNEQGQGMFGVTVLVPGTSLGTSTASDGSYRISLPKGKSQLLFSMVGYSSQTLIATGTTLDVSMAPAGNVLEELVVVGYGSTTKKDLTGAVNTVGSKDFNGGLVGSPEQLINGKTAGVQVMSNSGSPSSGSTIRIRGGASLSASNDPLIVLDGVPLETGGISGNSGNFLSLINPNDIESMTVLKDASSTAIYGSRASNGVLLITTKKGKGDDLRLSFSSIVSMQQALGVADMMSHEEFSGLINSKGTATQKALLGNASTDWLSKVFQDAIGTDNNLSLQGKISKALPFRASMGYYNQQGTLRTEKTERMTGALVLNPTFFNKHLTVNVNVKGARNNNSFANTDAIWSAVAFNPTQPVYSGVDAYGGYYESLDNAGLPATGANLNPLGLLNQEKHHSTVNRAVGNLDLDYKFHMLPELKAHVTLGYDYAKGKGSNLIPASAANNFTIGGAFDRYEQTLKNKLFTGYLNYNKFFSDIKSTIDVTAGHDYQYWSAQRPPIV